MNNDDNEIQDDQNGFSNQFSEDPVLMQMYFHEEEANAGEYQQKHNANTGKIILVHQGKQYRVSISMIKFSQLLEFAFNEQENSHTSSEQDTIEPILSMEIPPQIPLNNLIIKYVQKFMQITNDDPATVKLGKVKPYSVKITESCPTHIAEFIATYIRPMQTPQLKELIQFCRYMQIHSLLEVIYYHLATQYSCPYTENQASELMDKYQVKKFNSDQATEMKIKYLDYFKKLSRDFAQIQDQRKSQIKRKFLNQNKL